MPKKVHLYAVIRVDGSVESLEHAKDRITVTKVLDVFEDAVKEVERLNELNGSKGAQYFWQTTRYYPSGNSK